jgi:hypothetical protein
MNVRADMMEIVVTAGMKVVEAMLEEDRIRICGPKHARIAGRKVTRGGTVGGALVLGGRRIAVRRPRLRRVDGGEVGLPTYEAFGREDPLEEHAVEQMVGSARVLDDGALDTLDEQHAAARAHVGAALHESDALAGGGLDASTAAPDAPAEEHAAARAHVGVALHAPSRCARRRTRRCSWSRGRRARRERRARPRRADALVEQHAAARAHVSAALDTSAALHASAALDHAEPTRPSSNTPLLVPT